MFRVKVALVSAGLMALVTVLVYFEVTTAVSESITRQVEGSVSHAQQQILRSSRLEAVDLTTLTADFAREEEFVQVFAKANEDDRRGAAFVACEARRGRLEKERHLVGIIGLTDATGKLIARDRDQSFSWRNGEDLTKDYPSLALALKGQPNKDVWDVEGAMYRVSAAPVKSAQGQVLGVVFVGDVQSAADAIAESERSGVHVAYFYESKRGGLKIHASSFTRADGAKSESAEEKDLAEQLFTAPQPDGTKGLASPAINKHEATEPFRVMINRDVWVASAAPLLGNVPNSTTRSGFVVLASLSAAKAPLMPLGVMIIGLGLVGMLAVAGAAVRTSRRFLGPLDKIEAGVTEVINGNRDFVFESPSQDFEGLANGLNVMLARLLGRPEPGDEDESEEGAELPASQHWRGEGGLFVDEAAAATGAASSATSGEAAELAAEAADSYYARIWSEYSAARQQTGEGTEGMDGEQFIAKLKQNEAALCKKYSARMVRFKVVVKGNQATLKPVPIV